jgi:PRTRC genetic system protein C
MLITSEMPRVFLFNGNGNDEQIKLSDPDRHLSPEAVLNFYSQTYPMLTTAKIEGPEFADDELQFRFESTIGTKG